MTTSELQADRTHVPAELQEKVLLGGDLSKLTSPERLSFYNALCTSLGVNPLTQPFEFIILNGKLRLYAKKDCTDQLRKIHGVSIVPGSTRVMQVEDVRVVVVAAQDKTGRTDEGTGAVTVGHLTGDALANAIMKCETKAKRRVTLSICGLGMLDETEVETIAGVAPQFAVKPQEASPERLSEGGSVSGDAPAPRTAAEFCQQQAEALAVRFGFGKHKGKTPAEVPDDYLAWCEPVLHEMIEDPAREKFQAANQLLLEAVREEVLNRKGLLT